MAKFKLTISTPQGDFYSDDTYIITTKLAKGYMGIMANRSPVVSFVETSVFSLKKEENGKERKGVIYSGLLSTSKDLANIITEKAVWLDGITKSEAELKIKKINESLQEKEITETRKTQLNNDLEYWTLVKENING